MASPNLWTTLRMAPLCSLDPLRSFPIAGPVLLSAPAFSLVFPLLKMVLLETPNDDEEKEEHLVKVLQTLLVHAQLRSSMTSQSLLVDEVSALVSHPQTKGFFFYLASPLSKVLSKLNVHHYECLSLSQNGAGLAPHPHPLNPCFRFQPLDFRARPLIPGQMHNGHCLPIGF